MIKQNRIDIERRGFLRIGSLAVAALAMASHTGTSRAQAAQSRLDEKDPQAQSLGYKHDATQVDAKKFPRYRAGEVCENCQLFQAKPGNAWGPCPIFPGKQVNAKGWCTSYMKKMT